MTLGALEARKRIEDLKYKEVPPTSIAPTQEVVNKVFSTDYKTNFENASKDFWQENTKENILNYTTGSVVGKYGKDSVNIDTFFNKLFSGVKEAVIGELTRKKHTTENIQLYLLQLETSLKLLARALNQCDKELDIKSIIAFYHGFINSYIGNIIKKRE